MAATRAIGGDLGSNHVSICKVVFEGVSNVGQRACDSTHTAGAEAGFKESMLGCRPSTKCACFSPRNCRVLSEGVSNVGQRACGSTYTTRPYGHRGWPVTARSSRGKWGGRGSYQEGNVDSNRVKGG